MYVHGMYTNVLQTLIVVLALLEALLTLSWPGQSVWIVN